MVDKINQFAVELKDPNTDFEERLFALKFLLHLVGDLHQPLHCADNNDRGGNSVKISADGIGSRALPLHSLWDTQFVDAIARPPAALAQFLLMQITPEQAASWSTGTPEDWAQEDAYGDPPLSTGGAQLSGAAGAELLRVAAEDRVRMWPVSIQKWICRWLAGLIRALRAQPGLARGPGSRTPAYGINARRLTVPALRR